MEIAKSNESHWIHMVDFQIKTLAITSGKGSRGGIPFPFYNLDSRQFCFPSFRTRWIFAEDSGDSCPILLGILRFGTLYAGNET
ncbi:MAG: hypothetical protein ACI9UV_002832 [Algoriphagus sp.]